LFIYGYKGYPSQGIKIKELMEKLGYTFICPEMLQNNDMDFEKSVKIVRQYILSGNYSNIIVFGHSKGGLVALKLLQDNEISNRIDRIYLASCPYNGYPSVYKLYPPLLKNFPSRAISIPEKFQKLVTNFYPTYDNTILFKEYLHIADIKTITFNINGHANYLVNPIFLELLKAEMLSS
jgi:esterase/lipase